jgi:hypothetical protein
MAIQFDNTNTSSVTLRPGTAADAIIVGGTGSTASGAYSSVVGGQSNTASGGNAAVVGGTSHSATAPGSIVFGGSTNTASGTFSSLIGGRNGTTRGIVGNLVSPSSNSPIAFLAGASQTATLILGRETTNATATVLASDQNSPSTTNQLILPNNSAYYFRGEVIAGVTGAGDTKGWYVEGVIKRGGSAASTALVGTPSATSLYADTGAATWSIAVTADTTNGGLAITVTGAAATTIRWVAQIRTTEMTF